MRVRLAAFGRADAHVVALDFRVQHAVVGDRPVFEMTLDPVGMLFEEVRQFRRVVNAGHVGGADEAGDDGGQSGGRVAGDFLPALLLRDGRVANQEGGGALDEGENVEVAEGIELPQAPCEDDGKGDLVELNAGPVGLAVDPEILRKATVGLLRTSQVGERAQGGFSTAAGHQSRRSLHHVARPHQVVAAKVVVTLGIAPGDGGGRDEGAGKGLILVRQDNVVADLQQASVVAGVTRHVPRCCGAMPLLDEAGEMPLEGQRE